MTSLQHCSPLTVPTPRHARNDLDGTSLRTTPSSTTVTNDPNGNFLLAGAWLDRRARRNTSLDTDLEIAGYCAMFNTSSAAYRPPQHPASGIRFSERYDQQTWQDGRIDLPHIRPDMAMNIGRRACRPGELRMSEPRPRAVFLPLHARCRLQAVPHQLTRQDQ